MKKTKRLIASLLAASLVLTAMPATAFAAASEITGASIKGKAVVTANTDMLTFDKVVAGSKQLELTRDEMKASAVVTDVDVAFTGDTNTDAKAWRLTKAQDAQTVADMADGFIGNTVVVDAADTTALTSSSLEVKLGAGGSTALDSNTTTGATTALTPGDVVWIIDGTTTDARFMRVVISQASQENLGGDSTVTSPVKNVLVPVNVDFSINPLQVGNTGTDVNQVYAPDFTVQNLSDAPMMVTFNLTATAANGAQLVAADDPGLKPTELNASLPKLFHFALAGAKTIASSTTAVDGTALNAATITYDYEDDDLYVPFGTFSNAAVNNNGTAAISFLVDKAASDTALAANGASVASFRLYSALNTYAGGWAAGDIKLSGNYTITPISGADAADHRTGGDRADLIKGHNVLTTPYAPADADGSGFIVGRGTELTAGTNASPAYTFNVTTGTDLRIPFFATAADLLEGIDSVTITIGDESWGTAVEDGWDIFAEIGEATGPDDIEIVGNELVITDAKTPFASQKGAGVDVLAMCVTVNSVDYITYITLAN